MTSTYGLNGFFLRWFEAMSLSMSSCYGRIEEIYELNFYGSKPLTPVIFKCHWFDPQVTRQTHSNLRIVKI
jgi:tRNA(Phe) wybutosine-synthesizing methylase Tyw3